MTSTVSCFLRPSLTSYLATTYCLMANHFHLLSRAQLGTLLTSWTNSYLTHPIINPGRSVRGRIGVFLS
jgi:hypothetical protein